MIYVTADLHGCHPDQFRQMLSKAGFGREDFLFVLGDVIDRGSYGGELLLQLSQMPNAALVLGNHEAMLLSCSFLFDRVTEESLEALDAGRLRLVEHWLRNGGSPTLEQLRRILKRDPELLEGILEYLREAPLYERVEAGGRQFILTHAGLGNYRPGKALEEYAPEELLWNRPDPRERYDPQVTAVFGHTPTSLWGDEYRGKAFHGEGWICIDTGAALGGSPMVLRLDDLQEFYMDA